MNLIFYSASELLDFDVVWENSWSNIPERGESQETEIVFQALPITRCVTLGKALHNSVPLLPSCLFTDEFFEEGVTP